MVKSPGVTIFHDVPEDPDPVPYTLRIGVTGHRVLQDPLAVNDAVERLLLTIRRSLEEVNTVPARKTRLQWKVVSALAKGTDQIVARLAMEKLGASLDVVLPAEPDVYRKDFEDPDDLEEFNRLFEKADNYPLSEVGKTLFPSSIKEGYDQAGRAIADTCEILVAVWDGKPARGLGGTASIVSYACTANRLVVWINALNPSSPAVILNDVSMIPGTHGGSVRNDLNLGTSVIPKNASGWSSRFLRVAEYNSDRAFRHRNYGDVLRRNLAKMEETAKNAGLSFINIQPLLTAILPQYARADSLAVHYRKLHTRSATWLYRLAAISVTVAVIQALLFQTKAGWTVLEILALTGAIIMFRVSIARRWHEKYLNYRHLAERIRILLFQNIAGQQTDSDFILRQPLPFYPGPGGWVLDVLDEIKAGLPFRPVPDESFPEVKRFVIEGWVSEQADYHARNAVVNERHAIRDQRIIIGLLAGTLAAAFIHLIKIVHDPVIESLIISLVIILPAFASAQHAIGVVRDFERIATRSERMKVLLRDVARSLNNTAGWEEMKREIALAEDIMSTENHEWWVSLSFRRVNLPV
ncbi:MAG: hypothetical protein AB9888_18110 [Bacteroidales bacterium]